MRVSSSDPMSTLTGRKAVAARRCIDAVDHVMIQRCRAGDAEAFGELVTRYHGRVARSACRLLGSQDVEDVVQDVFLRVLQKSDTYRFESEFSTWLLSITVNCCRTHLRRRALRQKLLWGMWRRDARAVHHAERPQSDRTALRTREAIRRLPTTYREPIVLRYFEDLSIADIAAVLRISTTAVEARLSRGRRRLKSLLMDALECRDE